MGIIEGSRARIIKLSLGSPAKADTDAVHAAVEDNGESQVITTGITNPPTPRVITATAGGTEGDIKAIKVKVEGTNVLGESISEELGAFTVNTPGTKVGAKAFKTVTKITIPAHDGEGATTSVGFGEVLGLGVKLAHNTVLRTFLDGTLEETAPTVATSATAVESNTADLNSELNGKAVVIYALATE